MPMHDRSQWTRGATQMRKGKALVEFSRACATCQQPFKIVVTERIASGEKDSNSFGLKNCEAHRRNRVPADNEMEVEELRSAKRVMTAEVEGLYRLNRELEKEVETLKARLAQYELRPALETAARQPVSAWRPPGLTGS